MSWSCVGWHGGAPFPSPGKVKLVREARARKKTRARGEHSHAERLRAQRRALRGTNLAAWGRVGGKREGGREGACGRNGLTSKLAAVCWFFR